MSVTPEQISYSDNVYGRLEEVLYHLHSAVEELQDANDSACSDMVADLKNLITCAEEEMGKHDEILAEADRIESREMNRAYERSVM